MRIIHRNTTPSLASEPAQTSLGRHLLGAVTGGPDRKSPGLHSPSLLLKKRLALPIVALLAALAVGLLFLLPGGPLHAQDADGPIMYAENGTGAGGHLYGSGSGGRVDRLVHLVTRHNGDLTDMEDFAIENGVLRFKSPPDFEDPQGWRSDETTNTYVVTVQASDGGASHDRYGRSDH